jgi:hypothetical protein
MQQIVLSYNFTFDTTCFGPKWPSSGTLLCWHCYTALILSIRHICSCTLHDLNAIIVVNRYALKEHLIEIKRNLLTFPIKIFYKLVNSYYTSQRALSICFVLYPLFQMFHCSSFFSVRKSVVLRLQSVIWPLACVFPLAAFGVLFIGKSSHLGVVAYQRPLSFYLFRGRCLETSLYATIYKLVKSTTSNGLLSNKHRIPRVM